MRMWKLVGVLPSFTILRDLCALSATVCLLLQFIAIATCCYFYISRERTCTCTCKYQGFFYFSDRTCPPRNENDIIDTAIETCPCPRGAATIGVGTVW